jgi:hypothetical protein
MRDDLVRLAVFENTAAALEVVQRLQAHGIVEVTVLPVPHPPGLLRIDLRPHGVMVTKSRLTEARGVLRESGLLNRVYLPKGV